MKYRFYGKIYVATLLMAALAVTCAVARAEGDDAAQRKRGGQLYDNWPKLVGAKFDANHPLYPAEAKKSGTSTYRCKECHGWDYIGKEGRYAEGSHYTGIEGVLEARGRSEKELFDALGGAVEGHDFSKHLTDKDRAALAAFLKSGLLDWNAAVTLDANVDAGKAAYGAQCADCHGDDGLELDFKKDEGVQGVGWLARKNPQESLHKIRWGHPGSDMPSGVTDNGLTDTQAVELLNYTRTLP